jgi:hypothetical protein
VELVEVAFAILYDVDLVAVNYVGARVEGVVLPVVADNVLIAVLKGLLMVSAKVTLAKSPLSWATRAPLYPFTVPVTMYDRYGSGA